MGESKLKLEIDSIQIGNRIRDDLGDLGNLKDSIEAVGLLHPVVVTTDNILIAGERRLRAVEELGWTEVDVTMVNGLQDAANALRAEADENTARKALSAYEASRFRERQAALLAPVAAERQREHGGTAPGRSNTSSNLDEVTATSKATRKLAAVGTGYSGSTLDKVDKIREVAERGVTKVKGVEVEVPPEVREVAEQALSEVKQTGAAIDNSSRKVSDALTKFLDTPARRTLVYRSEISKGMSKVANVFAMFDADDVATVLTVDEFDEYALDRVIIDNWFGRLAEAQPGLQIVGGNPGTLRRN